LNQFSSVFFSQFETGINHPSYLYIYIYIFQSRPDRDQYVKIMTKNIDTGEEIQFTKRTDLESSSHGYAYDYGSIMHYGADYYSRAIDPTIMVHANIRMYSELSLGVNVFWTIPRSKYILNYP